MMHYDIKRLPLLKAERKSKPREYMFTALDDFSGEQNGAVLPRVRTY
jgi:hypothetical protein